jgi:hypothetical protein
MPVHEEPTRKRRYRVVPGRRRAQPVAAATAPALDLDEVARGVFGKPRHELVREAAYYRSLKRGDAPADADGDWAVAEQEIDALLRRSHIF